MNTFFELRVNRYLCLAIGAPARHVLPGLKRWFAYWQDADCELDDWEDRANS